MTEATSAATWVDVAAAGEVPRGEHRVYEVDGRYVAVYNVQDELYAIEDVCTHDGNPLADGPVEGLEVICPRHGARFCLRTGAALSPPAYEPVATFPVAITHGRLCIGLARVASTSMKQLWIFRHAHAEPYAGEDTDFQRQLNDLGRREALAMATLALQHKISFDRVIVSPAVRTLATAAELVRALEIPRERVHADERIYLADRASLVDIVRALPGDCEHALLVGHNPAVSRLARWLTDDDAVGEFEPATLLGTGAELNHWADVQRGLFQRLLVLRPTDVGR